MHHKDSDDGFLQRRLFDDVHSLRTNKLKALQSTCINQRRITVIDCSLKVKLTLLYILRAYLSRERELEKFSFPFTSFSSQTGKPWLALELCSLPQLSYHDILNSALLLDTCNLIAILTIFSSKQTYASSNRYTTNPTLITALIVVVVVFFFTRNRFSIHFPGV